MSKGLEAKNRLVNKCSEYLTLSIDHQAAEDFLTIEKELKALEIIINKNVHIDKLKNCFERNWNYETYNNLVTGYQRISKENYDLLKDVGL